MMSMMTNRSAVKYSQYVIQIDNSNMISQIRLSGISVLYCSVA